MIVSATEIFEQRNELIMMISIIFNWVGLILLLLSPILFLVKKFTNKLAKFPVKIMALVSILIIIISIISFEYSTPFFPDIRKHYVNKNKCDEMALAVINKFQLDPINYCSSQKYNRDGKDYYAVHIEYGLDHCYDACVYKKLDAIVASDGTITKTEEEKEDK